MITRPSAPVRLRAAAAAISPTAPLPMTAIVCPAEISASSAAVYPVAIISTAISAASIDRPSGICARLQSASGTLKDSAHIPSRLRPSFVPENGTP